MSDLKPCPKCHGDASLQNFNTVPSLQARIICSCGIEMRASKRETIEGLIESWNTRAERTCGEPRGFIPYDQDNFGHPSFIEIWCEHCDIELDPEWEYCPQCGAKVVVE